MRVGLGRTVWCPSTGRSSIFLVRGKYSSASCINAFSSFSSARLDKYFFSFSCLCNVASVFLNPSNFASPAEKSYFCNPLAPEASFLGYSSALRKTSYSSGYLNTWFSLNSSLTMRCNTRSWGNCLCSAMSSLPTFHLSLGFANCFKRSLSYFVRSETWLSLSSLAYASAWAFFFSASLSWSPARASLGCKKLRVLSWAFSEIQYKVSGYSFFVLDLQI